MAILVKRKKKKFDEGLLIGSFHNEDVLSVNYEEFFLSSGLGGVVFKSNLFLSAKKSGCSSLGSDQLFSRIK